MAVSYVRSANPIWYFPDLTGEPLNDEYYAFFLTNVFPYVPQAVYQDVDGTIPWNNPIEFYPNGTLPDNLYFNDSEVYRIEIRQGTTQGDPLIYEINDFIPDNGGGSDVTTEAGFGENQVTTSQFSEVNFVSPLSITTSGTYSIAPGWDLVLTGTGTATISQEIIVPDQDFINNPPFGLELDLSGWTTANLVQRFEKNGAIWSSITSQQDGYISMSITAQAIGSTYNPISFVYKPSSGTQQIIGNAGSINTGSYQVYNQTQLLIPSDNSDPSDEGYVDIVIQLKGTGDIIISNIQIVGQTVTAGSTAPSSPVYQQETNERQIDRLFHYYRDSIIYQPKDTILTAWNFPLNPFQFVTQTVTTNVAQTKYICDQTILHQEAASQIASGIATNPDRYGLKITPVDAATDTKFALIQYIDTSTTWPYWSYKLSALVKLRFNSIHSTQIAFKMLLMYRTIGAPPAISASEPISGWAGDELSLAAGWTAIKPINDPVYTVSTSAGLAYENFVFNGFQLPNSSTDTMYLAAVFYTVDDMNSSAGTKDYFVIDKISLVNNDFAIDTQPQTFDDVMRQCQFYYEKSYDYSVYYQNGGTAKGALSYLMQFSSDTSQTRAFATPFEFAFNSIKRAAPTIKLYAKNGASDDLVDNVTAYYYRDGAVNTTATKALASFWNSSSVSTKSAFYDVTSASTLIAVTSGGYADNQQAIIRFQYTANALLGSPTGIP